MPTRYAAEPGNVTSHMTSNAALGGFSDSSTFSTAFAKRYGVSPTGYRRPFVQS
jgi:AraC-like DNA-binding protein